MKTPFIDIHTHHSGNSDQVITVQNLFLQDIDFSLEINFPFSAAIHPWHSDGFEVNEVTNMLDKLSMQKKLLAIGETGLDKACAADSNQQKRIFELQIDFAEAHHKPLIIHAVKSWNDLTRYFKRAKVPVILHGYAGSLILTRQLIELGCYFSIGKSVMRLTPKQMEVIQIIPMTSLFLETDESHIPIDEIYLQLSKVINLSIDTLKNQIQENFNSVFTI